MRLRRIVAPIAACAAAICCGLTAATASAASINCNPPSSPACPALVGSVSNNSSLSGVTAVAISGNYAYTTAYYPGELTAINISNPANPVIVGSSSPSTNLENGTNIAIANGYAYVVSKNRNASTSSNDDGSGNSLTILDIHTDPTHPAIVGSVRDANHLFGAYGIAIQGNYAYVAAQGCLTGQPCPDPTVGNQFDVIDVSNPAAPTIVGNYTGPTTLHHADSVAVSGNYAFVTASYSNHFTVMDISNPAAPTPVASITDPSLQSPNDVAFQGNHAYVADQIGPAGSVTVIDVSNPTAPKVVGHVTDPNLNQAYRILVRGNFAYVSSSHADTIAMLNVSSPASPTIVATVHDTAHLHRTTGLDIALSGRYLVASSPYLSSESQALYPPFNSTHGTVSVLDLDPSPPAITLTSPLNGSNYKQFQTINATYSCAGGLFPITSCTGSLPSGATVNTSTLGTHTFTVNATDQLGRTASITVTYTVSSTGGPKPSVSGLKESASVWREHGPKHAKHKPPLGTTFTFNLSQTAAVTLTFDRCVGHRQGRVCRRTKRAGTIVLVQKKGKNKYFFLGKVGRKFLKPGTYKLVVVASANGKTSSSKTITFTIV